VHGLLEPLDTHPPEVERDPGLRVVGQQPARSHPQLEAPVGEEVQRGRVLGEDGGMPEIVVEDHAPHADRGGRVGSRHDGHGGGDLVAEVIGHDEDAVAQVLRPARLAQPLLARVAQTREGAEAERPHGVQSE
jgi:hypothetical protein